MGHWKGGAGEREVISLIQPWWQQVEPGTKFLRTPGSGGWAKKREVPPGFHGHGDLMTDVESLWPWSIEVKWRKHLTLKSLENFYSGEENDIWKYWDGCVRDAALNGKIPMLWFRGANVRGKRMEWRVITYHVTKTQIAGLHNAHMISRLASDFLSYDPRWFVTVA